jgi:epoxyqueuosine reductase
VTIPSERLKAQAAALGFDACGVAPASAELPELAFLATWLERGYGAGMTPWLARTADRRLDPRLVLPTAHSVIVTATNYNADRPFSIDCPDADQAHIARYAWGEDYHRVLSARLEALIAWMREQTTEPFDARSYVDTGPVQERVFAQHAGIGWIGKNCCLISEDLGSFIFLGVVLTSLRLSFDAPAFDLCGTCTRCLEACPTQALVSPGVLDANRCISYWTIEHRGDFPTDVAPSIGSHVYGCDICQEVCPWNAHAPVSSDPAWQPRPAWDRRSIADLLRQSDDQLREGLHESAMSRAKLEGMRRNLDAAATNAQQRGGDSQKTV